MTNYLCLFFVVFSLVIVEGQSCNGSFGEPVFLEDFGVHDGGDNYANPLSGAASTTYNYLAVPDLMDGDYTLAFRANHGRPEWHNTVDATNDPAGQQGNMLIVNASFTPDEFYRRTVTDLCNLSGATYRFSAKVMNVLPSTNPFCGPNSIPVNVSFDVLDTSGNVLLSQSTGNIPSTVNPSWQEFSFDFQLNTPQNDIVLVLRNNGAGGCGNDLAIDDISFRLCGEDMTIEPAVNIFDGSSCATNPVTLTANTGANNFVAPQFQWQSSSDGGSSWQDLPCMTQDCEVTSPTNGIQYRFLVNELGDTNANCFLVSGVSEVSLGNFSLPEACDPIRVFSDEPTADFDLTLLESHFANGSNPSDLNYSYFESESAALAGTGALATPEQYNSESRAVFVRVDNPLTNCFAVQELELVLEPIPEFEVCDADEDGITSIDFQEIRTFIDGFASNASLHQNQMDALNGDNPIDADFSNTQANEQTYYVRFSTSCLDRPQVFPIRVNILPRPNVQLMDLNFCPGEELLVQTGLSAAEFTFIWRRNTTVISDETTPNLTLSLAGVYSLEVKRNNGDCTYVFTFEVTSLEPALERYDLIENQLNLFPENNSWEYSLDGTTFQASSEFTNIAQGSYNVGVRNGACIGENIPVQLVEVAPFVQCGNEPERLSFSDLETHIRDAYSLDLEGFALSVHPSLVEAMSAATGATTNFNASSGTLYYRFTNPSGSRIIQPIEIQIIPNPAVELTQDAFFCFNDVSSVARLDSGLTDTSLEFVWERNGEELAEDTPRISVREEGLYTLRVTNPMSGCTITATTQVTASQVVITNLQTQENNVIVTASGEAPLTYRLLPNSFQSSPVFGPLAAGTYSFVARNAKGCESLAQETTVLFIPNFISPNGDGINDTWDLSGIANLGSGTIGIYDRYGKEIFATTTENFIPWDGTYLGRSLPSGTYWYIINLTENEEPLTGSIAIKR